MQHAHQKGIIHRDLKPYNILVVGHSGKPKPKGIDFCVAKAIERQESESILTREHQMAAPLCELFQASDGLDVEHVTKIRQRLKELPVGKQSRFRYQVKDEGETVELQATLIKLESQPVGSELWSSNAIIQTVMACFHYPQYGAFPSSS